MNARLMVAVAATLAGGVASGQTTSTGSALAPDLIRGHAYPNRPIRIIPGQPGGGAYVQVAAMRDVLSHRLGQPLVMDARTASVMGGIVARSQPDGYTLLAAGTGVWFAPLLGQTDYDTLRDLAAISSLGSSPSILVVHPTLPVSSVKELIALAKSKPGALNYSSSGTGSSYHLAGELFKSMTGVDVVRVPYTAAGPTITAVLSGEVQFSFGTSASVAPHIKSGKVKALAHTGAKPTPLAPGLPSMAASGLPGFEITSVNAMFAPARTPVSIITRLSQELVWVLAQEEVKQRFLSVGAEAGGSTPEQITARVKSDYAAVAKLIKKAGITEN